MRWAARKFLYIRHSVVLEDFRKEEEPRTSFKLQKTAYKWLWIEGEVGD